MSNETRKKFQDMMEEQQQKWAVEFLEMFNELDKMVAQFQKDHKVSDNDLSAGLSSLGITYAKKAWS